MAEARHQNACPASRRTGGVRRTRPALRLARALAIGLSALALVGILASNTALAFNTYQDIFVTLAARPLAMGGAAAAVPDPSSVFSNPACLAPLRTLRLLYNHSARHFPGSQEGGAHEWDQLDGDTEAVVVPLPLCTYAHGFTLSGEMGYDYRGHPAQGLSGYPREELSGTEEYDALAFGSVLPAACGIALRRNMQRFTPAPGADTPAWLRLGEGMQWGLYARVLPGTGVGYSELKHDYDWTVLATATQAADASTMQETSGFPTFSSRLKQKRSGWCFQPCGWLTLAQDEVRQVYRCDDTVFLGLLHDGPQERTTQHTGAELRLGNAAALRWGNYGGHSTSGLSLALGGLQLNYAEAQGLLPEITGAGDAFKDVHIYGFDWAF